MKTTIYSKIFEAKKSIGTIVKDSKNPFFKSNYLSLNGLIEAVELVLMNNELVLLQPIKEGFVTTQIIDISSGEMVESSIGLPNIQDAQKLGSAITYFRRYTLQSLLGLQAEDDDGNNAVKPKIKPKATSENLEAAKIGNYTIEQVKSKYSVTPEQEKNY